MGSFPNLLKLIDQYTGARIVIPSTDLSPMFDSNPPTCTLYGDISGYGTVSFKIGVDYPTPEGDALYVTTIDNDSVDTAHLKLSEESLSQFTLSNDYDDYDDDD